MRRERPAIVLVMAILQIVFGSIGLLANLCNGGIQLAGGPRCSSRPAPRRRPSRPTWRR